MIGPFHVSIGIARRDSLGGPWKASTSDALIEGSPMAATGLDAAHAVAELRLAVARQFRLSPDSLRFRPATRSDVWAVRTEARRRRAAAHVLEVSL